jgi:hypothetical protein
MEKTEKAQGYEQYFMTERKGKISHSKRNKANEAWRMV